MNGREAWLLNRGWKGSLQPSLIANQWPEWRYLRLLHDPHATRRAGLARRPILTPR